MDIATCFRNWWDKLCSWGAEIDIQPMRNRDVTFLAVAYLILMVAAPYEPTDDLLRHLVSWRVNYDYREMFAFTHYPSINVYWVFDHIAGSVYQLVGPAATLVMQLACVTLFFVGMTCLTREANPNLRACLIFAALAATGPRLMLARPATFSSCLFLFALGLALDKTKTRTILHCCMGGVIAALYYLFPIYLVPLAIIRRVYLFPLAAGIIGWLLYGGNEFIDVFIKVVASGIAGGGRHFPISELTPIFPALVTNFFVIVPLLHHGCREPKRALAGLWFFLANQTRFLETAFPVIISCGIRYNITPPLTVVYAIFGLALLMRPYGVNPTVGTYKALENKFPKGSTVYAMQWTGAYQAIYGNPGVKIAPGHEPEWTDEMLLMETTKALKGESLNCATLAAYGPDYILEKDMKETPSCFTLHSTAGPWRIWTITPYNPDKVE